MKVSHVRTFYILVSEFRNGMVNLPKNAHTEQTANLSDIENTNSAIEINIASRETLQKDFSNSISNFRFSIKATQTYPGSFRLRVVRYI